MAVVMAGMAEAVRAVVEATEAGPAMQGMAAITPGIQAVPPTMAAQKARKRIMQAGPFGITV